eukprot:TRINITY_DN51_c1_g4_i1.p1 TRINITY_DN51_c1_g4~~TRINITY_DN51_c1_g4_i1.p1  ORF type:complete len:555 (+),score=72.76 TRINITY_DN51_c1_g4_i1:84-1748(+)
MGSEPSKEATTLETLQEMCKAGSLSDGGGGWAMHKRYKEMNKMVEKNRLEYLRCGGVAATVALMLSRPEDEELQEFCLGVVGKARPDIHQVALGWKPIIAAVKTFPTNNTIQEVGTFLLLRASLTPEMEGETLDEITLLNTSADILAEGVDGSRQSTLEADDMTPDGSSLCGEVIDALQKHPSQHDVVTELRFKTLALTSHFIAPRDAGEILKTLRGVLSQPKSSRKIMLSSLFAMQRMYQSAQLHVYNKDIELLLAIIDDLPHDVETLTRIIRVMESFAHTPSAPGLLPRILQKCKATMDHHPEAHEPTLDLLNAYSKHCASILYQDRGSVIEIACAAMMGTDPVCVEKAWGFVKEIVTSPDLTPLLAKGGASQVSEAFCQTDLRLTSILLDGIEGWDATCFSESDLKRFVDGLCRYATDTTVREEKRTGRLCHYPNPDVSKVLQILTVWAETHFIPASVHEPILPLVEHLFLTCPAVYDRPAMKLLLVLSLPHSVPRVHILFCICYTREQTYWFPDRVLMRMVKEQAATVPRDRSDTWSPGKDFQDYVYGKQ